MIHLLIAILAGFLALVPQAHAAVSPLCATVNGQLAPVSAYTAATLQRAEQARAFALSPQPDEAPAGVDLTGVIPNWAQQVQTAVRGLIETQLSLKEQSADLHDRTACHRVDLLLLECAIEETREKLAQALAGRSLLRLWYLEDLLAFLRGRFAAIAEGGRDPTYKDRGWGAHYSFDQSNVGGSWCCPDSVPGNACVQMNDESCTAGGGTVFETADACVEYGCIAPPAAAHASEMCPFSTDYLPPARAGYGCDLSVLGSRIAHSSLAAEAQGLQMVEEGIAMFERATQEFAAMMESIATALGLPPITPAIPPPRRHRSANGCLPGWCAGAQDIVCETSRDCASFDTGSCVHGRKACSDNRDVSCSSDAECAAVNAGTCTIDPLEGVIRFEVRGPFSVERDELRLLDEFRKLREAQGRTRAQSDELKLAGEFPPEQADAAAERRKADPLEEGGRERVRLFFRLWNAVQGSAEANLVAKGTDANKRITEIFIPLRGVVRPLALLSSDRRGLRQFAANFAYFLRRSCIWRPCNARLEQVIRLSTTDSCFPYTNGDFLGDTPEAPRWTTCMNDAGLTGAP